MGWLHSRHSFSFGGYQEFNRMAYRSLRVLNDDLVEPGAGFDEHGHRDMEIITWVLEGALEHRDSTGSRAVLRPGELQVMTAGSGIRHSEMNASPTDRVHFLQIWILPVESGIAPSYQQRRFPSSGRQGRWQLMVSPEGADGTIRIHQDARLSIAELDAGHRVDLQLAESRHGYLHVALGEVRIAGTTLEAGDAITFEAKAGFTLEGLSASQLLLFDLA